MAQRFKLTWQAPARGAGRWKKVYRGKTHYFDGGTGKSDLEAYRRALAEWERTKVAVDTEAEENKPHRADYEAAISEWATVLAWGREHGDRTIVAAASAKIEELRTRLSSKSPTPIDRRRDSPIKQIGMFAGATTAPPAEGDVVTPGEAHNLAMLLDVPDHLEDQEIQAIVNRFVVGRTWRTRIAQQQAKSIELPSEFTLEVLINKFVENRRQAGGTAGGIANLQRHLNFVRDQLGNNFDARTISGKTFDDLHQSLLSEVASGRFSRATAAGLQTSLRSFIRWLWGIEVISELPRNLTAKSLRITAESKDIHVFSIKDIRKIYSSAKETLRLYILLALNCGMTQIDISDIRAEDVSWSQSTWSRKRGKTRQFENVPTVTYALWPETLDLLKKLQSNNSERLLVAPAGGPLKFEVVRDGKTVKNDHIGLSFRRLIKPLGLYGQFKMLKKTSASLLRDHQNFSGLESLFLDHAPRSVSDKHYAKVPTQLLADALNWLRGEFKLPTSTQKKKVR